jgi:hypothetical protein
MDTYGFQKSLSLTETDESSSHPHSVSLRTVLILSSDIHLGLASVFLLSAFLPYILSSFFINPVRATCLTYTNLINLINIMVFGEEYKLWI